MIVPIYLVFAVILLAVCALLAISNGAGEDFFAAGMAVAGVVVMVLTLLLYPLTRRRQS
jgi:hypothetical protein